MSAERTIALLRGINVGGHRQIAMSDLLGLLIGLGFAEPRSLLQSGNLVFAAGAKTGLALERLLEAETEKRFGHSIDYFVRTAKQWEARSGASGRDVSEGFTGRPAREGAAGSDRGPGNRSLRTRGTARNWNTILKLATLVKNH